MNFDHVELEALTRELNLFRRKVQAIKIVAKQADVLKRAFYVLYTLVEVHSPGWRKPTCRFSTRA